MIITIISDLHGEYPTLPGGDLLIIAGDLTGSDKIVQYEHFAQWLNTLNYKKIIIVGGNHDNVLEREGSNLFKWWPKVEYLCDSGTEFEGLKIWGSPWTSQFPGINRHCCAFSRPFNTSLKDRWDLIPDDIEILVTHSPPFRVFDSLRGEFGACVGDGDLREFIDNHRKLRLHVFGHIHEHGGRHCYLKKAGCGNENDVLCINASILDGNYIKSNDGVKITYDEGIHEFFVPDPIFHTEKK